ncbi:MAG: hypothetical protein WCS27_12880 [Victivallaceae bacterium]
MSSELEKKRDELIALLDKATSSKNAATVNEAFDKVEKVELKINRVILRLEAVERYLKNNNRKKAIYAYQTLFFKMSPTDSRVKSKKLIDTDAIQAFLDEKAQNRGLRGMLKKLGRVHSIFRLVLVPVRNMVKAYNIICNAKKVIQKSSEVSDLYQAQKELKTAESYRKYYEKAGILFSEASSAMGLVTSILPRGASDYCDFIFTVAKNCVEAVKIVSEHTEKILKLCKEIDELIKGVGEKYSKFNDGGVSDDVTKHPNDPSNIYLQ